MTYAELVSLINTNLTRVGNNRVSAAEIKQVCQALLDFAAAIDNTDAIPTWTNGLTFQLDGTGAGKYCTHPDANGKKRIFETKIANNTGHEPPTDPNFTEDEFWEEISASAGSAIHEWAPGVYGVGLVIVYHSHSSDGRGLYILLEPVRPFNSTGIEAEIVAGKWDRLNIENLQKTLARGNSAGDQRIRELANPVDPQDADTKAARETAVTALETSLRANVPVAGDDLEKIYNLVVGIGQFAGNHDASGGALPAAGTGVAGAINKGDYWIITPGGIIAGIDGTDTLQANDVIYAKQSGGNLPAHFFGVNSNVDLATDTVLGLVKLVQAIGAGAADAVLSTAALKPMLDAKKDIAANVATNITANILGGAVTIAAGGVEETEVYLKTDANLNISWTGLNDGGIIYLRIERTATNPISLNFNGAANLDCFMDGSTQQLGAASPLSIAGHNGATGINRIHHRISIEAVKDITANKLIYLIRESNTGSITV